MRTPDGSERPLTEYEYSHVALLQPSFRLVEQPRGIRRDRRCGAKRVATAYCAVNDQPCPLLEVTVGWREREQPNATAPPGPAARSPPCHAPLAGGATRDSQPLAWPAATRH